MGLEEVRKEILAKAKSDAAKLEAEAAEEASKIKNHVQQQFQDYKKRREAEKQKSLSMLGRMHDAQLQTELKMLIMDKRKKWVEKAFEEARKKLSSLPEKHRKEHVQKLLKRVSKEIEIGTIYCASKDKKAVAGYKVIETDMLGGLIAETNDEAIRVDYSYETLLEQLKDNKLAELNKILFG